METKSNESTDLRPDGDRVIDAPLVSINIPEFIKQIKSEDTWKNSDRNAITVYKTNGLRIVLIALHASAEMPRHIAEGIISVQVMEGEIKFTTDAKSVTLKSGEMIALHKGLHHSVNAIRESVFLLTLTTSLDK
ncbi:MAG TPA: cupin domain-containing protein [Chitinophagales bacterium]|nr:cupin domain-containing protein [Chitinophagales bacterium]